jgi:hypothetical protein
MIPEYNAVIGIDPGGNGCSALLTRDRRVFICRFKNENPERQAEILFGWALSYHCFAVLELVHSMPTDGKATSHTFGRNVGRTEGMLLAYQIPFTEVQPTTWQFEFGLGKIARDVRKKAHQKKARELFPELTITMDAADGILIAEYGYRLLFGGLRDGKNNTVLRPGTGITRTAYREYL